MSITDKTQFYLYLLTGYATWPLLSGAVQNGTTTQIGDTDINTPFMCRIMEKTVLIFLPFLFVTPVIIVALIIAHNEAYTHLLYLPLNLLCMFLWVVGAITFLIAITTWIPDIGHIVASIMRIAFLATPIIWQLPRLGDYQYLIWINPFFIPLEAFRYSLSGIIFENNVLLIFPAYSIFLFILGLTFLNFSIPKVNG